MRRWGTSIPPPGCSGFHTGLINEDRCHDKWVCRDARRIAHFRCSATVPILHHLHVYLISISAGCSGWTRAPSWNLSGKVSLRSPALFFLIKLIRRSATGARLTAARDRWSTYSNPQAVILQNCSEMWATWVLRRLKAVGMLQASQLLLTRQFFKFFFFLFFFISCCFWALHLGL